MASWCKGSVGREGRWAFQEMHYLGNEANFFILSHLGKQLKVRGVSQSPLWLGLENYSTCTQGEINKKVLTGMREPKVPHSFSITIKCRDGRHSSPSIQLKLWRMYWRAPLAGPDGGCCQWQNDQYVSQCCTQKPGEGSQLPVGWWGVSYRPDNWLSPMASLDPTFF